MFGSEKDDQSIWGRNTSGFAAGGVLLNFISLFNSKVSERLLWAHTVSILTVMVSPRSRPCTKGVAIASTAQAAYSFSPLSNVNLCGVISAVTGNAQIT